LGYYIPLSALATEIGTHTTEIVFIDSQLEPASPNEIKDNINRKYSISIPFAPSMQLAVADEVHLVVALPEGANHIKITVPIEEVTRKPDFVTYRTMDYLGRKTLHLTRKNIINSPFFTDVKVEFDLPFIYLIHKPLILILIIAGIVVVYQLLTIFISWFSRGTLGKRVDINKQD
jgi:hypothetical protein